MNALELLCERRWGREKTGWVRGCEKYVDTVSNDGAVCERGVEGRRDDVLLSDVLLSRRADMLASPAAVESMKLPGGPDWFSAGYVEAVDWDTSGPAMSVKDVNVNVL